jgi:AcrR family transcriptional regulator
VTSLHGSRLAPDERRDQLIRLGVELVGRDGYDQLSITAIARAAGISKGLLYHYFATKSDFVVAVLRQAREELEQRMGFDESLSPVARLDANLDAFLAYAEEHAAGYRALARARTGDDEAIREELAVGRHRRIGTLTNLAAQLAGVERREIESPALTTVLSGWLAFSEDVVVRWLTERHLSRDQVRDLLRQALLANLASVSAVDATPAATRLAEAALSAAGGPAPVAT